MRIISVTRLKRHWDARPDSRRELTLWKRIVEEAAWRHPADVKQTFETRVDFVEVASGATVAVFDVKNNVYRLVAAIHYVTANPAKGRLYVLRILTHREYDTDRWKDEL